MNTHTKAPTKDTGPDAVDIHAGMRMREIRRARGISQEALAEAVGISFQQIQKYERGANRLSLSRAFHIARVLGVSVADFYAGLSEDWKRGELPHNISEWMLSDRGQRWGAAGESLPADDFFAVLRVVDLLGARS